MAAVFLENQESRELPQDQVLESSVASADTQCVSDPVGGMTDTDRFEETLRVLALDAKG